MTAAGPWSPSLDWMARRLTKAWTAPDNPKPRMRGHRVSQNMKNPSRRLLAMVSAHPMTPTTTTPAIS